MDRMDKFNKLYDLIIEDVKNPKISTHRYI